MDPRLTFVTLAVADVERSRAFYVDGLGWPAEVHVPGEVLMIRVGPSVALSLWDRGQFTDELGQAPSEGLAPVTLAHNVGSPGEVDAVLDAARAAGATVRTEATARDWGGYSGYFDDPDGFAWEVAHNPQPFGAALLAGWRRAED